VAEAVARGWTTGRTSDLEILGEDLAAVAVPGFRLPPGGRSEMEYVPNFVRPLGTRLLVPSPFVNGRCTGCGLCIENCPVQTISRVDGRARIVLSNCIRCYCCHEVCPEQAITLHQPWLGRKLAQMGS
jgi:ferredoxin